MRAVVLDAEGAELRVGERPGPEPGDGELLVSVVASSINPIDVRVATGRYPWGVFEYPVTPGFDFAGIVEALGDGVDRYAIGDEVLGYWHAAAFGDGTWAEYATVSQDGFVARKPAALSFEAAAALPLAGVTALLMVDAVEPLAGERVLIVGAGGAIGGYAVQLAASAGAHVIATARPGAEARLRDLGAAETIDYAAEVVAEAVRRRHPDGVAALIDLPNGPRGVAPLAALVRDGGRVASACFGADVEALAQRGVAATNVAANACDTALVARLVDAGLRIGYDDVRALDEVPAAVARLAGGRSGKTVIAL